MTRIRSLRRRRVGFEALEGRLALSTGMGLTAGGHHAEILAMRRRQQAVPISFTGHVQENGATFVSTDLSGVIGRDRFTGSGTGRMVGKTFQGGAVYVSNGSGSMEFHLQAAVTIKVGRRSTRQVVPFVTVAASGKYAQYVGSAGTLTSLNLPAKPTALASFSGTAAI